MSIFHDLNQKYLKVAKGVAKKAPFLVKSVPQSGTNLFTGLRVTKPAAAIGVSALALYTAGKSAYNVASYGKQQVSAQGQPVGMMPAMNYLQPTGGRDLGASGDLVFGLHNMRRG